MIRCLLTQPLIEVLVRLYLAALESFYLSESPFLPFVAVSRNRPGSLWRWRRTDRQEADERCVPLSVRASYREALNGAHMVERSFSCCFFNLLPGSAWVLLSYDSEIIL